MPDDIHKKIPQLPEMASSSGQGSVVTYCLGGWEARLKGGPQRAEVRGGEVAGCSSHGLMGARPLWTWVPKVSSRARALFWEEKHAAFTRKF